MKLRHIDEFGRVTFEPDTRGMLAPGNAWSRGRWPARLRGRSMSGAAVNPRPSTRPALHYGDSPDGRAAAATYCGRLLAEVQYWATPETARHMTFTARCKTCQRALARRQRP